jgi:hypothetical protein
MVALGSQGKLRLASASVCGAFLCVHEKEASTFPTSLVSLGVGAELGWNEGRRLAAPGSWEGWVPGSQGALRISSTPAPSTSWGGY